MQVEGIPYDGPIPKMRDEVCPIQHNTIDWAVEKEERQKHTDTPEQSVKD